MNIYHYDDNNVYTYTGVADESPLEPGVYLIPAKSTTVPIIPEIPNNIRVFDIITSTWIYKKVKPLQPNEYSSWNEKKWKWVEDKRKKQEYLNNIKTLKDSQRSIERKNNINNALNKLSVTTKNGNTFNADELSQTRINRAIVALKHSTDTILWRMLDNMSKLVTKSELQEALLLAVRLSEVIITEGEQNV